MPDRGSERRRSAWLEPWELRVGLGCMRMSTDEARDEELATETIAAAAGAGITVFDTARAYGRDDSELSHNERLLARALRRCGAERRARIVTKGGINRSGGGINRSAGGINRSGGGINRSGGGISRSRGGWLPDGRAKTIRGDCEASLAALEGLPIDLYLIHAPDPRTPWRTSVRALARLAEEGMVRRVGVSNVNRRQLDEALDLAPVSAVEVALGVLDDRALRGGMLGRCEELGITLIAHSPLGGPRRTGRLARLEPLTDVAAACDATPAEVALAWLLELSPAVVAIPGARRPATAISAARAAALELGGADREKLRRAFGGARETRRRGAQAARDGAEVVRVGAEAALDGAEVARDGAEVVRVSAEVARDGAEVVRVSAEAALDGASAALDGASAALDGAEVVVVMGIPGAGKSRLAAEYVGRGYVRLNRDERGASLRRLAAALEQELASGARRIVLDNTYLTRAARSHVIDVASRGAIPARCIWLDTPLAQAQVNLVERLLDRVGALPSPDELRVLSRREPGLLAPTSQMRALRELEPPSSDEGFAHIEAVKFVRARMPERTRTGVFVAAGALRVRGVERALAEAETAADAPHLVYGWQPDGAADTVEHSAELLRRVVSGPVHEARCAHPAGPPICWCRPPLPGLALAFSRVHRLDTTRSVVIGAGAADRTLARTLGTRYIRI